MANTKINFTNTINCSLSVGDMAYVSSVLPGGVLSQPIQASKILDIEPGYIIIEQDPTDTPIIDSSTFLLFAKHTEANDSSLKGYYADVTLENYSNEYAELYALSSEITVSSK
tara:strand:+ start:690 stop:1028 length:339 start_codon:yes stop_codon:yes gene_type:complete